MDRFFANGESYSLAEKSLKLLPASDLHSRITLLEDAARACRAELRRRPSHCQEAQPQPAVSSSSCMLLQLGHDEMGVVAHELCDPLRPLLAINLSSTAKLIDALDPLCLEQIASALGSALELARCGQTCTGLRQACQDEAERKVRALVKPFDDVGMGAHAIEEEGGLELIAAWAGGWPALLAGRQGLLDTSLPQARVGPGPHGALAEAIAALRHGAPGLCTLPHCSACHCDRTDLTCDAEEAVATLMTNIWVIWDIRNAEGEPQWCTVTRLEEQGGCTDGKGNEIFVIHPYSGSLPGGPCPWEHSFDDGSRPSVHFAADRTNGWGVSISIVGPDVVESEVLAFRFDTDDLLNNIVEQGALHSHEQVALDSDAQPVPGVTRYQPAPYGYHEDAERYLLWKLTMWVDHRSDEARVLADVEFAAPERAWPDLVARAKERPCARLAAEPRPVGGWNADYYH